LTYRANAATQANAAIDPQLDNFGKLPFVTFFVIAILFVFPVGFALVLFTRRTKQQQ
jgi:hypothetical protein